MDGGSSYLITWQNLYEVIFRPVALRMVDSTRSYVAPVLQCLLSIPAVTQRLLKLDLTIFPHTGAHGTYRPFKIRLKLIIYQTRENCQYVATGIGLCLFSSVIHSRR